MPQTSALVSVLQNALREFGATITLAFERTEQKTDNLQHRVDTLEARMGAMESSFKQQQSWRPEVARR